MNLTRHTNIKIKQMSIKSFVFIYKQLINKTPLQIYIMFV